ncbi:MAG: hypothetical protein WBF55_18355, partial [Syntrophobacteria bacterium]
MQKPWHQSKESRLRESDFALPLKGTTKLPDQVSPVSALHSTIYDKVFENMNRRTAEQETAEYR